MRKQSRVAVEATGQKPVLVIGHQADLIQETLGNMVEYVFQEEQLGTGHAVRQAEQLIKDRFHTVLVVSGDMPLLRVSTLKQLIDMNNVSIPVSKEKLYAHVQTLTSIDPPRNYQNLDSLNAIADYIHNFI